MNIPNSDYLNSEVSTLLAKMRQWHDDGEMSSVLHGTFERHAIAMIDRIAIVVSAFEQGAGAELRRLKDYLGDQLPSDWEMQRMDRWKPQSQNDLMNLKEN